MARRRSLLPREHGAYAQLGAPLLAALLAGAPTLAAGLLAAAAIAAFLANEPLLVVLQHRGPRVAAAEGRRARVRLIVLGVAGVAAGVAGLVLADAATRITAAIAAVPALGLVALAYRRAQHSLAGELIAAVALPVAAAPIAVASGLEIELALALSAAWAAGYAATVAAVHRVIARHKRPATRVDRYLAAALIAATAAAATLVAYRPVAAVGLPLLAISAALVLRPPRASRLRAIGVVLVVASAGSLALAIVAGGAAHALRG